MTKFFNIFTPILSKSIFTSPKILTFNYNAIVGIIESNQSGRLIIDVITKTKKYKGSIFEIEGGILVSMFIPILSDKIQIKYINGKTQCLLRLELWWRE